MTRYGFIGLGSMGAPMAGHLADLCGSGGPLLVGIGPLGATAGWSTAEC